MFGESNLQDTNFCNTLSQLVVEQGKVLNIKIEEYFVGSGCSAGIGTLVSDAEMPVNKSNWLCLTHDASIGISTSVSLHCV